MLDMKNIKSMFLLILLATSLPSVSLAEDTFGTGIINNNPTKAFASKNYWVGLIDIDVTYDSIYPVDVDIENNLTSASGQWVTSWLSGNFSNALEKQDGNIVKITALTWNQNI
jgi:hypothetical protein